MKMPSFWLNFVNCCNETNNNFAKWHYVSVDKAVDLTAFKIPSLDKAVNDLSILYNYDDAMTMVVLSA